MWHTKYSHDHNSTNPILQKSHQIIKARMAHTAQLHTWKCNVWVMLTCTAIIQEAKSHQHKGKSRHACTCNHLSLRLPSNNLGCVQICGIISGFGIPTLSSIYIFFTFHS